MKIWSFLFINGTACLISGGWANGNATYETNTVLRYSSNINEDPMEVAPMVHARDNHACTIFNSPQHYGRPVLIVAGSDIASGSGIDTAEILDFTKEGSSWQESKLIFALLLILLFL